MWFVVLVLSGEYKRTSQMNFFPSGLPYQSYLAHSQPVENENEMKEKNYLAGIKVFSISYWAEFNCVAVKHTI